MADAQALLEAIRAADGDRLQAALDAGADPNATGAFGAPALTLAVVHGAGAALEPLLAAGAAVDGTDGQGNTALMQACARGRVDSVRLLLAHGASPNHRNKWGLGPRSWAEWPANGPEVIAALDSPA